MSFYRSISLIALALAVGLTACSQSKDLSQRESDALTQTVDQKEAILNPLAGRYVGVIKKSDGSPDRQVTLVLIPVIMIVQNPGRNDVSEVPTLGGNLNIISEGSKDSGGSVIIPVAQYQNAKYDTRTNHLRMSGSINSIGGSMGTILNSLDGYVNGKKIVATVSNTSLGVVGVIDVERAD